MKALITGASGQLGQCLHCTAPQSYVLDMRTHAEFDLTQPEQIATQIALSRPTVVINAAAYTAVDRAESDSEQAYAINAKSVGVLAESCRKVNATLIHVSTDYVFDGQAVTAYEPGAATNPVSVYGASKLAGEQSLVGLVGASKLDWAIVRTSWVYAPWGKNFVLTMLRLMRERGQVSVVCDQIGTPTSALYLARFLWQIVAQPQARGVLHYTDSGVASWFDFAVAINEEAVAAGLLPQPAVVKPITTAEYATPAKRPALSILATKSTIAATTFEQPHWRTALREVIKEIGSNKT
jgi:dTDP-4-dehydrorhamnose reductase